jgi:hypothetical protein
MRLAATMLALVCLLTQGCASTGLVEPVKELGAGKAAAPARLTQRCAAPADLPAGALSAGATERLWARDRSSLDECRRRHAALADYYVARDARLAGSK